MDNESFGLLEQRVADAIRMIARLRNERDELVASRETLQTSLRDLESRNERLTEELRTVKAASVSRDEFENRKQQIENRVQSLLERFEELDKPEAAKQQAG